MRASSQVKIVSVGLHRSLTITGFMGAGKSVVAEELGRLLGCPVVDLDRLITERDGRTPEEIIVQEGEEVFREVETKALREVLEEGVPGILALGGGAWIVERNRGLINQHHCRTIWLDVPFEVCWRRMQAVGESRPLAPDESRARSLYDQRLSVYALAQLRVKVGSNESYDQTAAKIAAALRKREE